MEKMNVKAQTEVRSTLYGEAIKGINELGYETETIKGGTLIHLPDGYFAKMTISVCDATKFDLEKTRSEYQTALEARAARAEAAAKKAREKVEKEAKTKQ